MSNKKSPIEDETIEVPSVPFQLFVNDGNNNLDHGDVPVRWCITPDAITLLEQRGVTDPHILIVNVRDNTGEIVNRQLIPMSDLMTYVRFHKSEKHTLHAFIIDGSDGRKYLKNTWLNSSHPRYEHHPVFYGDPMDADANKGIFYRTKQSIEIPEGVFGAEPHAAIKWFANLWHENRTIDECQFRRRLILAATVKWIPMLMYSTLVVLSRIILYTMLSSFGFFFKTPIHYFFKPFDVTWDMFLDKGPNNPGENFFLYKNGKNQTQLTLLPMVPLLLLAITWFFGVGSNQSMILPAIIIGSMMIVLQLFDIVRSIGFEGLVRFEEIVSNFFKTAFQSKVYGPLITVSGAALLSLSLYYYTLVVISIFVLLSITVGLYYLYSNIGNLYDKFNEENNDYSEMRSMLCPKNGNMSTDFADIPLKNRTIRLWYKETKHKVCKPMQR